MSDNLRVKPILKNAEGSFREHRRILRLWQQIRSGELFYADAELMIDDLLIPRLETLDGSDVEAELDKLSLAEYAELVGKMAETIEEEAVPTPSAGN